MASYYVDPRSDATFNGSTSQNTAAPHYYGSHPHRFHYAQPPSTNQCHGNPAYYSSSNGHPQTRYMPPPQPEYLAAYPQWQYSHPQYPMSPYYYHYEQQPQVVHAVAPALGQLNDIPKPPVQCPECGTEMEQNSAAEIERIKEHMSVDHLDYTPYRCVFVVGSGGDGSKECGAERYSRARILQHISAKEHGDYTQMLYRPDIHLKTRLDQLVATCLQADIGNDGVSTPIVELADDGNEADNSSQNSDFGNNCPSMPIVELAANDEEDAAECHQPEENSILQESSPNELTTPAEPDDVRTPSPAASKQVDQTDAVPQLTSTPAGDGLLPPKRPRRLDAVQLSFHGTTDALQRRYQLNSKTEQKTDAHCHVCKEDVKLRYFDRHVWKHVPKPSLKCFYCDYRVRMLVSSVKKHIQKEHPDQEMRVVDERTTVREAFATTKQQCFPSLTPVPPEPDRRMRTSATSRECAVCKLTVVVGGITPHTYTHLARDKQLFRFPCQVEECAFGTTELRLLKKHHVCAHSIGKVELNVIDKKDSLSADFIAMKSMCFGEVLDGRSVVDTTIVDTTVVGLLSSDCSTAAAPVKRKRGRPVSTLPRNDVSAAKWERTESPYTTAIVTSTPSKTKGARMSQSPVKDKRNTSIMETPKKKLSAKESQNIPKEVAIRKSPSKTPRSAKVKPEQCNVCLKPAPKNLARHIYMHMAMPIYFCLHCPFANNSDSSVVLKHSHKSHSDKPSDKPYRDEKYKYVKEYELWKMKCFGVTEATPTRKLDKISKDGNRLASAGEETKAIRRTQKRKKEDAGGSPSLQPAATSAKKKKTTLRPDSRTSMDATPTHATPTNATPTSATPTDATPTDATPTSATPPSSYGSACHLCADEHRYRSTAVRRAHLIATHFQRDLFICTICNEFSSKNSKALVMKHTRREHPHKRPHVVDLTAKYSKALDRLYDRCFKLAEKNGDLADREATVDSSSHDVSAAIVSSTSADTMEDVNAEKPQKAAVNEPSAVSWTGNKCSLCGRVVGRANRQRHLLRKHPALLQSDTNASNSSSVKSVRLNTSGTDKLKRSSLAAFRATSSSSQMSLESRAVTSFEHHVSTSVHSSVEDDTKLSLQLSMAAERRNSSFTKLLKKSGALRASDGMQKKASCNVVVCDSTTDDDLDATSVVFGVNTVITAV